MIEVYDTCNIGIGSEPTGGVTLKLSEIEGKPGISMLIPITREAAEQLVKGMTEKMGLKTIETANLADMRKETHAGNDSISGAATHLADAELSRLRRH